MQVFFRMSGYSKEEIIGQRPGNLLQGWESESWSDSLFEKSN
jgi:hypothetical protein